LGRRRKESVEGTIKEKRKNGKRNAGVGDEENGAEEKTATGTKRRDGKERGQKGAKWRQGRNTANSLTCRKLQTFDSCQDVCNFSSKNSAEKLTHKMQPFPDSNVHIISGNVQTP